MTPGPGNAASGAPPLCHPLAINGLNLVVYEWPGEGDPILLVHATGFHARCWRAVIERLPGRHVFAVDMPSHGASDNKPPPYSWSHFGDDLAAVTEALDLRRVVGVGHSMGGYALVLAVARLPQRFRALMLVDPVITGPELARGLHLTAMEHPVARRRRHWDSPEQMFQWFSAKEPYARWDPVVLRDYCNFGLVPAGDGQGFELACPPDLEAEIYVSMRMGDIYAAIATIGVPVEIIRARARRADESRFSFSASPTWEHVSGLFRNARDEQLPDHSHFIPMEIPGWMARRIAAFADRDD
ncbi:MAG: alpha/beta hydrolase [Gammaproteobacteria bacterium]|nr:alpha/beta hydrolase [Gammaproteobacteria bacterium]MBK7521420.1 alpha/beta hydrolase [Gammaproteobacteria bacterium]MBK7729198.1 alpha/beta hydrolase [Gammaproteobacteria bacterium]MBP6229082.1 alpha/beta hydrolase [Pseudomonadales bacterium]